MRSRAGCHTGAGGLPQEIDLQEALHHQVLPHWSLEWGLAVGVLEPGVWCVDTAESAQLPPDCRHSVRTQEHLPASCVCRMGRALTLFELVRDGAA